MHACQFYSLIVYYTLQLIHSLLFDKIIHHHRRIIHCHHDKTPLLPNLQYGCIIDGTGQETLVIDAVDEELIVQGNKYVLSVPHLRVDHVIVIQGNTCCVYGLIIVSFWLKIGDGIVWLPQISHNDTAFSID